MRKIHKNKRPQRNCFNQCDSTCSQFVKLTQKARHCTDANVAIGRNNHMKCWTQQWGWRHGRLCNSKFFRNYSSNFFLTLTHKFIIIEPGHWAFQMVQRKSNATIYASWCCHALSIIQKCALSGVCIITDPWAASNQLPNQSEVIPCTETLWTGTKRALLLVIFKQLFQIYSSITIGIWFYGCNFNNQQSHFVVIY